MHTVPEVMNVVWY